MKRSKIFSDCCNSLQWFLMGKNNSKLYKKYINHINRKNIVWWQNKYKSPNKRHLSAEGYSLLPSALRPRLLGIALFQIVAASTIFSYLYSCPVSAASLTLTIPSSFSLNITPGPNGVFSKSEPGNINVKTDNSSGYTLSIKAKNSENSNSLINSNISSSSNNKLNSISESTTEDLFKSDSKFNNTWGYLPSKFNNEDNTNFLPGPTTEESLLETTEEANETGTNYNIVLGAKVDDTISSGSYNNSFIISAMTNAPKYPTMQDWAADYTNCEDLPSEQVINLLDKRDNNVYQVAKLKDGKCWMVENLKLGDDKLTNRTLTSANTDISSNFTLSASIDSGFTDYDVANVHIDAANGGYYNWYTATAGTGRSSTSTGITTGSICPKGWRLPTSGDTNSDFSNLTRAYGGTGSNETNAAARDALMASPIPGFTYSGSFFSDSLGALNSNGYWWSATTGSGNNSIQAYYLSLGSDGSVNPLGMHYKDLGASVRCMVRGPEPVTELLTSSYASITDNIEFVAGDNIEFFIIGYPGEGINYPYYIPTNNSKNFGSARNKEFVLTVVPKSGYILDGPIMATRTNSKTTIIAKGAPGSYDSIQNLDISTCTAEGKNVTDTRNGESYTVAKRNNYCHMLSNLRLASGTTLTPVDSDVSSNFTLPTEDWNSDSQDYYSKKIMKERHISEDGGVAEYFYNWYAAKANDAEGSDPTTSGSATEMLDNQSKGSICPHDWGLPDVRPAENEIPYWSLMAAGYIRNGYLKDFGRSGAWSSSIRYNGNYIYSQSVLYRGGYSETAFSKADGLSVRCVKSITDM